MLCEEAQKYGFATVCINPFWIPIAVEQLKKSDVGITTVIGFPLGATSTASKVAEARDVITAGATEIDMVINIGALKSGDDDTVYNDIKEVVQSTNGQTIVKVIIETALLADDEKRRACLLAKKAEVDFVKTSTGFNGGGATVKDIALMKEVVGPKVGVKASGGVRDYKSAIDMIEAGATRIGASASVAIVSGVKQTNS